MSNPVRKLLGLKKETKTDGEGVPLNTARSFAQEYAQRAGQKKSKRLLREREKYQKARKEERASISAIAQLELPSRSIVLEGVILDASRNGVTFRPASNYMLKRVGTPVEVHFEGEARSGIIRSSRIDGHGIQLFDPLTEDDLKVLRDISIELTGLAAE